MKIHLFNPESEYITFRTATICGKIIDRKYITDKTLRKRPTCKICKREYFKK